MPTYDYVCQNCEHAFEAFQSITAKPLKKCPECGKSKLKRLIGTGAGIIFKGEGFYETDYRSEDYKKAAKADAESAGKSSDASDSKGHASDSKPDASSSKSDAASKSPAASSSSSGGSKTSDKGSKSGASSRTPAGASGS